MAWLDIATLGILGLFVLIGIWKGFLKTFLKLGATVIAVVVSRIFGEMLGKTLFPHLISGNTFLTKNISSSTIDEINSSFATIIGTAVIFIIMFVLLRIVAGFTSKIIKAKMKVGLIDRIFGALFGLVLAVGAIYAFAFVVNILATATAFFDHDAFIYSAVEETVIFKYFF